VAKQSKLPPLPKSKVGAKRNPGAMPGSKSGGSKLASPIKPSSTGKTGGSRLSSALKPGKLAVVIQNLAS